MGIGNVNFNFTLHLRALQNVVLALPGSDGVHVCAEAFFYFLSAKVNVKGQARERQKFVHSIMRPEIKLVVVPHLLDGF